MWNSCSNTCQNLRHASAQECKELDTQAELKLYSTLWSDWPTSRQKFLCHRNCFATQVRKHYFSGGEKRRPEIHLCLQASILQPWYIVTCMCACNFNTELLTWCKETFHYWGISFLQSILFHVRPHTILLYVAHHYTLSLQTEIWMQLNAV